MADNKLIIELLKEVRDDQKDHSKTLIEVQKDVGRNADDLEEHMAQTRAVKELVVTHKEIADRRFEELEEPSKVIKILKNYLVAIGAVAAAGLAIAKFVDYL